MWPQITCGLVAIGTSSIASAAWPGNERARWLFSFVALVVWILGASRSGSLARSQGFPDGKLKKVKLFVSGGVGFL